jgi:hypothetical protein
LSFPNLIAPVKAESIPAKIPDELESSIKNSEQYDEIYCFFQSSNHCHSFGSDLLHSVLFQKSNTVQDFAIAEYLLRNEVIHYPDQTKYEYPALLEDLIKKYTLETATKMKLCHLPYNLVFKVCNSLKLICQYDIVNYTCQAKLCGKIEELPISQPLKGYLTFEKEL